MSEALNNVLAQAEAASQNYVPQTPALVGTNDNALGAVATPQGGGALSAPSQNSALTGGGLVVDEYLTMNNGGGGFRIGKDMKGLLDEIEVEIDMDDVAYIWSVRSEVGGLTKFIKSYDGVTSSTGSNFQYEIQKLMSVPGNKTTEPYQTAEIPATLLHDVQDPKKDSTVVIHEGTTIGITPSLTGFKNFQKFLKKLQKTDPSLLNDVIRVKLTSEDKSNNKNNKWCVLDFELLP